MLTLEEAIEFCQENADKYEDAAYTGGGWLTDDEIAESEEQSMKYKHLVELLHELKKYREKENCNKPYWAEMEVLTDVYDIMGDKTWASKMRCSNCNFITYAIEGKFSQYNYCPQCGVKIGVTLEEVKADANN